MVQLVKHLQCKHKVQSVVTRSHVRNKCQHMLVFPEARNMELCVDPWGFPDRQSS